MVKTPNVKAESKADETKIIPVGLTADEYRVMGAVLVGAENKMDALAKTRKLTPAEESVRRDVQTLSDKVASGQIKCHVDDDFFKELGLTVK